MRIIEFENLKSRDFNYDFTPQIDLKGKKIAAFGGIGALAEMFLYSAALCGAELAIVDFIPSDEILGAQRMERFKTIVGNLNSIDEEALSLAIASDVRSIEDTLEASRAIFERLESIDVAVNFAGVHHPEFDLVLEDPVQLSEAFKRVIELNLTGAFNFTLAMARNMVPKRKGHIIHLCSSASRHSLYGSYGYNASKHGVEGLVQTAAAQLAPFGIRVNGIAPGTVVTDLNRSLSFTPNGEPKPRAKSILAHTPTKRFASAEGIAETLLAMCVEQRHLNGNLIFPDDGYNIEGHSWPEGNVALYQGGTALENLYSSLNERYPKS